MPNTQPSVLSVIDLAALQKHIAVDDIYNHVPKTVTRTRETLLHAMERDDAAAIHDIIHDLDAKITGVQSYGSKADEKEIAAYRGIITIGRVALHAIPASGYSTTKPSQPIRSWNG